MPDNEPYIKQRADMTDDPQEVGAYGLSNLINVPGEVVAAAARVAGVRVVSEGEAMVDGEIVTLDVNTLAQLLGPQVQATDNGVFLVLDHEAVIDGEVVPVVRWSNSLLQINRLKESNG